MVKLIGRSVFAHVTQDGATVFSAEFPKSAIHFKAAFWHGCCVVGVNRGGKQVMSKGQTTVFLDRVTKERLRAAASRQNLSMSQVAKVLIGEGLDRLEDGNGTFPRLILEEMLISLFSIEETVVRGFFDQRVKPNVNKEKSKKILDEIDSQATKRLNTVLKDLGDDQDIQGGKDE